MIKSFRDLASERQLVEESRFRDLHDKYEEINRMLGGLRRSLHERHSSLDTRHSPLATHH